jgi:hypothetical protein
MNFIVFTSSHSLVTIGPVQITWLGRRLHLPVYSILSYPFLSYPATILAKREVSIARIPAMEAKKFTILL